MTYKEIYAGVIPTIAGILGIPEDDIAPGDELVGDLGFTPTGKTGLAAPLATFFDVKIKSAELIGCSTIRDVAVLIKGKVK